MTTPRVPPLPLDEAKAAADEAAVPDYMAELTIFQVLLNHPQLARAVNDLLATMLWHGDLDPRLRELVIMRIAWLTACDYEWTQHWRVASRLGVTADDLVGVRDWLGYDGFGSTERAVLAATDDVVRDGAVSADSWAACEREKLPVGLLAGSHMPALGKIAERHPGLKLHIDHLGRHGGGAGGTDAAAWADLPEMLALARLPHVAVKMSGAPSYSSEPYPYRNIHGYLRQILDAFGPQRCFWGTDITRMPCSYRQCVTMFTEELPWLKGGDQELVMGRAVCEWLGWKHPALS